MFGTRARIRSVRVWFAAALGGLGRVLLGCSKNSPTSPTCGAKKRSTGPYCGRAQGIARGGTLGGDRNGLAGLRGERGRAGKAGRILVHSLVHSDRAFP